MAEVIAYNFTVDDTSPQIVYSPPTITTPSLTPDLQGGWNQYFNGSGFNAYPGQVGRNASLHFTSMDGASFSIAFKGTGIQIYGLAIGSSFSLALDDEDMSSSLSTARTLNGTADPTAVLLASFSGLAHQDHVLSVTAHTAGAVNDSASLGTMIFDRAVVTVSTGLTDASVTSEMINDMEMQFTGSWTFVNDSSVVPEGDHTCHLSQTSGDQAQYSFRGSSVELSGLTNATSGLFNISLSSDSTSSGIQQQQISSHSLFLTHTTLFYASGLDRNATHTITITNLENKTLGLDNMSITVVSGGESVQSASPSTQTIAISRFSRGEVAAIAVASTLAFLILLSIILLFLCCYRRRKRNLLFEERKLKALSAAHALPDNHRRWSTYGQRVVHAVPGQVLSSAHTVSVYDRPAPVFENIVHIAHVDEEDEDTDSGVGHGQEKRGSIVSMPSFDNIPRDSLPTTSHVIRPKSISLSRWSAWFTSSTSPSSASSRQHLPVMTSVPIVSPRPVLARPPVSVLARTYPGDGQDRRSSSFVRELAFLNLDIPRTSPFQVDFEKHGQPRNREPSDQARASNAATLGAHARDMLVSFLDFASSGAASFRGSSRSRSRRHSGSNKSASHSGNEDKSTASRHAQGSSGPSQSTSTGLWTLSLSVDPPQRQVRDSQLVPTTAVDTIHSTRHPFSMVSAEMQVMSQESPTDSLPMSVSDINFNLSMRSEEDEEDAIASRVARFHLPRHPPLPSTPHSYDYVPIIRPPDFERASHMRQMSAPNLGLSEQRRPYVAQTSIGRRLAQVRAQALESQRPPSQTDSPAPTEQSGTQSGNQPGTRPSSNRARILPLPFINFGRSGSGSQ